MKEFIRKYLLLIIVVLNILYITYLNIFAAYNVLYYNRQAYFIIGELIFNLIISIILFIRSKNKCSIINLLLLLITNFALISTIYAFIPKIALLGMPYRLEGLYAILNYLSIFYISSYLSKTNKRRIVNVIIALGLFQAVYGYLQLLKLSNIVIMPDSYHKIFGTLGNPNFFASYILLSLLFSIGLYIEDKDIYNKILYFIISIILVSVLIFSNCMSCMVGLAISLLLLLPYTIIKKNILPYIILIVVSILLLFVYAKFNNTRLLRDIYKTGNEVKEISTGNYDSNYGTHRLGVWRKTMDIVPNNIIHGVGIDNFFYAFNGKPLVNGGYMFDKAHNEYLQILVTEGIFSLISYISLFIYIIIKGLKKSFNNKIYYLLPVIGYLVQAFFSISVIEVAPIFYLSLGLLFDNK